MTLAAELAGVISAVVALLTFLSRVAPAYTRSRKELARLERLYAVEYGSNLLRKSSKSAPSVSLRLPLWALVLFEPEEAQRWSREVEAHIWELLERHALKQARRDRRKLIARGLLLAIALRATKRFNRARPGN
jgi:hypothetical protein